MSLLNDKIQIIIAKISAMNNEKISFLEIDRISPIKYPEYFANPPFMDKITIPRAIPAEENMPIIVSDEDMPDSIMLEIPSEKMIANAKIEMA